MVLAAGCEGSRPPTVYPIALRVTTDGRPMPGAQIYHRERLLGGTDEYGMFRVQTLGTEGAQVDLTLRCPAGFVSPQAPVTIPLRSAVALDRRTSGFETQAECAPDQRIAAVIVRAPNRGNLPVLYQGREITRTDPQGVAHMIFRVPPGETLSLRLDTSGAPLLRPESPTLAMTTNASDDVYVLTQNFEQAAPPRRPRPVYRPPANVPIRIPSRRPFGGGF